MYRLDDDGKECEVEREFVFSENRPYVEMSAGPLLLRLLKFQVSEVSEGRVNGLWICIFAFHAGHLLPRSACIPPLLQLSRYLIFQKFPSLPS